MTHTISTIAPWVLRILVAIILLQTLFFKFTASEESVYIFSTLGMEPWGRIATGVLELIAALLILIPKTSLPGAFLSMSLMAGALFFHFTKLGIVIRGDGGQLFIYGLVTFVSSVILLIISMQQISNFLKPFLSKLNQQ